MTGPIVVALAAAACGTGTGGDSSDADAIGAISQSDLLQELEDATDRVELETPEVGSEVEVLEEAWADNRRKIVERIQENGWGVDPATNVLTGPAGFTIDLNNCPSDWNRTGGISEDSIFIGKSLPTTGPLAAFGDIGKGMDAYFAHVNATFGGVDGLRLDLQMPDDAYQVERTVANVDQLMSDGAFAITTLGSPNTLAVYDQLNEACVPQPFVESGHPAWGDPVNHPWTTGMQLSYTTEALLWGNWIRENLEPGTKVGALVMDNDFGNVYQTAFEDVAETSGGAIELVVERHDPADQALNDEMTSLAAENPDVLILMTTGESCPQAIIAAANAGMIVDDTLQAAFTSSTCKGINAFMAPAEASANGWLIVGGGAIDLEDSQYSDSPFAGHVREILSDKGLDLATGNALGTGIYYAWPYVEALRIAAELEGGIDRPNFILALRAMELDHPMLLDGISFAMDGNTDAYFIEGADISVFEYQDGTDASGAPASSWRQLGGSVDLNGTSPRCAYDPASQTCG